MPRGKSSLMYSCCLRFMNTRSMGGPGWVGLVFFYKIPKTRKVGAITPTRSFLSLDLPQNHDPHTPQIFHQDRFKRLQ